MRMLGSVAVLIPALVALRQPLLPLRGERIGLVWVGQLQVSGFLVCGILGLAIVPPGRAIVLAYTMPLWAIPIGLWLAPEQLSRNKKLGAAVGFAGLLLFMNPSLLDWRDPRVLLGNALLLLAAMLWAAGSCFYRGRLWRSPFWAQTLCQLAFGTVTVVVIAFAFAPEWSVEWTPGLVAILAYNWVVTTALGYFLWNKVLAVLPAAVAGQVLTLTPIVGFLLSTAMFGGAITLDMAASIALIVAGLAVTLRG